MNFATQDKHLARAAPTAPPRDADPAGQDPGDPPVGAEPGDRSGRRRRRYAWIGTAASAVLFLISLGVLYELVSTVTWSELRSAFTAATVEQVSLAILLVCVSYLFLTCYDALALRQLAIRVPYRTTALASFTSYAVSFNLGFPLLTAGTIRYWIYSGQGLSPGRIAALTIVAGFTFWLGMGAVLGLSLLREAEPLTRLTYTSTRFNLGLGLAALAGVLAYLAWVTVKRRSVKVKGWRLELPGLGLSLSQMLVGAGDVCAAAGVLYVLLPPGHGVSFETFLAIYVVAAMLGIASHAPGGLGVFEATILLALSGLPRESVLGALLLFRVCYYLVPFVVALAALGAYEIAKRVRLTPREAPDDDGADGGPAG
ncbi:lysylphosphatidylglycerol synthase domain-containing protein [Methylobacterium isbiliense]|jgi:uncharacterized membrane protein YbhN (UPF0104 family)|uniref:Inner membrane protein YbhN n=1 Tax=Methylobacterium isbiliense TaxID=315478 RepID=A0ABQ4SF35_9HYPH|nr:lysylphosphatidylglycerol synthase domain-containing protein [Methylobacterium isbiliense]MDN3624641.1 lysylphosphatidylglycerol synthase domain-containing protein [Methylobacterium isbiliense]GJE01800.1 hypothetical protein GMJLKIPL_3736 [Methylobacterium isbiliense]